MLQSNKVCIYNRKKERQSKKHTYSIQTVHIHLHIKSCAARGGNRMEGERGGRKQRGIQKYIYHLRSLAITLLALVTLKQIFSLVFLFILFTSFFFFVVDFLKAFFITHR